MACIRKRLGRYVIDCYDQNGKRYRKTLPMGTNKDQARKELREIEARIERRTFLHEKKTPFFSMVKAQWLEYKKTRCRETTWEMYGGHLKNHFADLDGKRIDRITTATVENFITAKQGEAMSLGTLRKVMVTLNEIMAFAVRHRMIDFNPVRDAERPKSTGKVDETHEMSILTPDQISAFLDAEPDEKYKTLFLVALMTGARQGEILGLKWSDIDFIKKQIHIKRTFNHERWFELKTKGSIRKIDLAPMVVRTLAEWKLKSGGQDDDLVFRSEAGTPIGCYNLTRRHFVPALKKAGLQRIRFHDLRHTYASLLLSQGENLKYVQIQMGHSSPTVTLNVYAHLMKGENQEAAVRLESSIFQATGHNLVTNEKKGLTING
jgi:integrase